MSTLATAITNVREYLQITATNEILTDAYISACVDRAVKSFSKDRPREMKYDAIGNGEYSYALPTDWVDRFSFIADIEYPGGEQIENLVDRNEIKVVKVDITQRAIANVASGATSVTLSTVANAGFYKDGNIVAIVNSGADAETNWASADGNITTGVVTLKNAAAAAYSTSPKLRKQNHFRFLYDAPLSSEFLEFNYVIPHTLSATVDTIFTNDFEFVCHLAASLAAQEVSAQFAKRQDSSIGADSVNYEVKSTEWRDVAKEQERLYREHIGIGAEIVTPPAGLFIDTDPKFAHGRKFIWHGGRYR